MARPIRPQHRFIAPVFAWGCALFAAGCGGTFTSPGGGTAGTNQAGTGQGGGAQGGSAQAGGDNGGAAATGGDSPICGGLLGAGCVKGQYCDFPKTAQCGAGDQTGSCTPIPNACGEIYAPVCGCDDRTYSNACSAAMAGVSVARSMPCEPKPGSCVVDGVTYADGTGGIPASDGCNICSCAAGKLQCTLRACPVPKPCGARAGNTCSATEYCAYTPDGLCGAADAEAVCKARPTNCSAIVDAPPVCGCDGKSYENACLAAVGGTGVQRVGACSVTGRSCIVGGVTYPDGSGNIPAADGCNICSCSDGALACTKKACPKPTPCGGFAGQTCAMNQYCAYVPGQACGAADASSTCMTRPDGCTADVNPVCGCDTKTYSNACQAAVAGFGYSKLGACSP